MSRKVLCKVTTTTYILKAGTSRTYKETGQWEHEHSEQSYSNLIQRPAHGTERQYKANTVDAGYRVTRIVSKSPDGRFKTIRTFDYNV